MGQKTVKWTRSCADLAYEREMVPLVIESNHSFPSVSTMIYSFLIFILYLIHPFHCQLGAYPQFGYGYSPYNSPYNSAYISPYAMRIGSYGATNGYGYGYSQPYGYGMAPYSNPYDMNGGYG